MTRNSVLFLSLVNISEPPCTMTTARAIDKPRPVLPMARERQCLAPAVSPRADASQELPVQPTRGRVQDPPCARPPPGGCESWS